MPTPEPCICDEMTGTSCAMHSEAARRARFGGYRFEELWQEAASAAGWVRTADVERAFLDLEADQTWRKPGDWPRWARLYLRDYWANDTATAPRGAPKEST